jgi:cob(I)alamin adenosyltransferase
MKNYSPKTTPPAKTIRYRSSTKPVGVYYYGNGKGKTTAALGAALRAAGQGRRVLILQAVKGDWPTGEKNAINRGWSDLVEIKTLGRGFVGIMGDNLSRAEHQKAAASALETIESAIRSQKWQLIILDEATDMIELDLISEQALLDAIRDFRNFSADLIITGHRYFPAIANKVDIVTEMKNIKHHYTGGMMAKKGLDY